MTRLAQATLVVLAILNTPALYAAKQCNAGSDLQVAAKASAWSYSIRSGFRYNGHTFPRLSVRRLQTDLCTKNTRVVRHHSRRATVEAIVTWNDETLVIAFAGTTSESVRRQNLDAHFDELLIPGVATHRGWSQATEEFANRMDVELEQLAAGRQVLVTGHSSGGSLAAYYVAKHLHQGTRWMADAQLITLGAARFGQPDFAKWMTKAAERMAVSLTEVVTRGQSTFGPTGWIVDPIPGWQAGLSGVGEKLILDLGTVRSKEQLHDPMNYRLAVE